MSLTTVPEVKNLGFQDFEEMGLPPVLYKYRRWDNIYHRRIIKKNELYFARPDSFEDPLDCHIPLRYDLLTDDDIMERYRKDIREQNSLWDDKKVEKETIKWFNKGLLRDNKRLDELEKDFWQEFNDRFGVLSLTPIPDSKEMWEKYANNYTGFCVGFKTLNLVRDQQNFGGGGDVWYFDKIPELIPEKQVRMELFQIQMYSKEKKWEFEQEYRLTKLGVVNRKVVVPQEVYEDVIIGPKIRRCQKRNIIRTVKKHLPKISIKEAYFENGVIKIREINS